MNDYWNLGFSDVYGAGKGDVEGAQDIMAYLFDLLRQSGREGFASGWGEDKEGEYDWMAPGKFGWQGEQMGYDLQGWQDYLGSEHFQEEGGASEVGKNMASTLLSMLQGSGIEELTKGYGRDLGDISSEFTAQIQGLKKGYSSSGKGGRYGKVSTGGRDVKGGGRSKYMSDIYGLQQKQQEMQQGLKDQFSSDFYKNIATWQGLNPAPYIEVD